MKNRYSGTCKHCGKPVPAGTGQQFYWNGKWEITHDRCPDSGTIKTIPVNKKEN